MRGFLPAELTAYLPVLAGVFGLLLGSFLNVCIYRIPRDLSVAAPRSFCPECGAQIAWFDDIPLVSYLFLGGKCRRCRQAIGLRYPLVELATGFAYFAITLAYGWTPVTLKWLLFESLLIVLFATDIEERILPDELTLGGVAAGIVLALFVPVPGFIGDVLIAGKPIWASLANASSGAILLACPMWLLAILYQRVRQREGLGLGDVKLVALLGVFLGLEEAMSALLIGAVAGSVVGIAYIAWKRKAAWSYELPFGSFLCAGAALLPLLDRAK